MNHRLIWQCCLILLAHLLVPAKSAGQTSLICESQNNQRQYCAADTRGGVSVLRQMSQAPCTQNQTWGYDGRGIWVDRGCRAEFHLGRASNPTPLPGPAPGNITCESKNNQRQSCNIDTRRGVRLVQRLSQAPCIQNQTWGYDYQGLWVDRGCRAVFAPGNGPGAGVPPPVVNFPRVKVDTSGRGDFASNSVSIRVTRGFVDTSGQQPSVTMRGGNASITFYGVIDSSSSNRDFTMRITGSDRGNAQGRAQVRLNGDRNEVEMIMVNGRVNGGNFKGSFSR